MRLILLLTFISLSFKVAFGQDTYKVVPAKSQMEIQVSGQIESSKQCSITSKTEGYFYPFVSVGDRVKIGQVMGSFKNEFLDANLQSTIKKIQITQSEVENLTKKLENYEKLYSLGLASKNEILDLKNNISLKQSEIESLKAQLKTYNIQKNNFKLSSNCEGYIINMMYLYFPVEFLNLIKSKKVLNAKLNDETISLKVKEIIPVSEGNLVKVKTFSEKALEFPLNFRQSITLYVDGLSGFKIPKKALVLGKKGFFVYKIYNGKKFKEKVNIIKDEGDFIIASGNLKDGDEVEIR